jgi:hypothetical protein
MLRDRDDPEHADRDHQKPDQRRHGADLGARALRRKEVLHPDREQEEPNHREAPVDRPEEKVGGGRLA